MSKVIKVTKEVYVSIGLHAAKFPRLTVLGYLIASQDDANQVLTTSLNIDSYHAYQYLLMMTNVTYR